jgi:8-oxo-dGTP pyrophosphatase MutT (NUDIX family)
MESLRALIEAVREAGHVLDGQALGRALCLYEGCRADPRHLQAVQHLAPEYGVQEFLLPVDADGRPSLASQQMLAQVRDVLGARPGPELWFGEAPMADGGGTVLLVVRWFCHLIGVRHRTVHLFIDHPCLPDHTLVQVRGPQKAEAPGCFDLPVAGHVEGLASASETVYRELAEELSLTAGVLRGVRELGSYELGPLPDTSGFLNVEHCDVYRARLTPRGWLDASVSSPEVAALAAFHLPDLERMMARFPDRFASGLKGSFALYREDIDRVD